MEYFGYATECWLDNNGIDVQIAISVQEGPGSELNSYLLNGTDIPISKIDPAVFKQCEATNPIQITNSKNGDAFVQELLNITNQNTKANFVGFDAVDVSLFDKLTAKTSQNYQLNLKDVTHCLKNNLALNTNYTLLKDARLAAFTLAEKDSCLTTTSLTTLSATLATTEPPSDNSLAIGLGVAGGILGLYSLGFCGVAVAYALGVGALFNGVVKTVNDM